MVSSLFGLKGRIGRGGWWFAQFMMIVTWGMVIAVSLLLHDPERTPEINNDTAFLTTLGIGLLLSVTINVCSTVKRYHDRNKSGFWFFISFIPFIGAIWQLIECGMLPGDDGSNDYGPPPGSGKQSADYDNDHSSPAGGGLAKLDDNYLAEYAKKIAQQQTAAPGVPLQSATSARPVFGKR